MNKVKYYIVFTKLNKLPEAVFRSRAWAERFIDVQKNVWNKAKFSIYRIEEVELNVGGIFGYLNKLFTNHS